MNPYAFLSLFSSIISIFLGNYIYYKNPDNRLNQLIAILCFLVAYLSFVEFGLRQAESYETAYLWSKGTFLWPMMTPIILNIVLIATRKNKLLKNKLFLLLLFLPSAAISLVQLFSTNQIYNMMILDYWGWTTISNFYSPFLYFTILWITILGISSIILSYTYYRKTVGLEKQQTLYILTGLTVVLILSSLTEIILPIFSIKFPEMTYFASAMGLLFISYGISMYRLPSLTPSIAADEIVSTITNFLFITDDTENVKYVNPTGLKLLGYRNHEIIETSVETILPEYNTLYSESLEEKGEIKDFETILKTKNGDNIPVILSKSPIIKKSTLMGILYLGTDIRKRKAVEKEKRAVALQTINRQSVLLELYQEDISDLETTLKRLTETDSSILDVDRVSVWFFNEDKTRLECSDLYNLVDDSHEEGLILEAEKYPNYVSALKKSNNITAMNAQTHKETMELVDYLKANGIISLMDVPIWLQGKMVGVLCHESQRRVREWNFEEQDVATSISYMISLSLEASKREKFQKQIINSLEEKEVLLREVHHRVKNNMQIISSLLNLQSGSIDNPEVKDIFNESQNRVRSMSMIHEQLYQTEDLAKIDFNVYVNGLIKSLFQMYSAGLKNVTWEVKIENVKLDIEAAIPCGLIINELVSNCLKYAFKDRSNGKIWVEMDKKEDITKLKVKDNGVGLPDNFKLEKSTTLGLKLVITLVDQLGGELEVERENGTSFNVTFTEIHYEKRM